MITHRMPLDDMQEAFEMAAEKKDGAIKILIDIRKD
jgi:threonine dehydrogenase-like Zn-dependent dehydrogenase